MKTAGNDVFKELADHYDSTGGICENAKAFVGKILEQRKVTGEDIVLDFGAGTGLVGVQFVDSAKKVVFVDPSKEMMEVLRQKIEKAEIHNAELVNSTIDNYKGEKVDYIACSFSLHHVDNLEETLKHFPQVLKDDGCVYVCEFKLGPHGPGFTSDCLVEKMKQVGFSNVTCEDFGQITITDHHHNRQMTLDRIFLVAKK